ncbi:tRNA lysidine(34) synthetase TilS [Thalassotalea maritima]|uniref:tRNA lysidine(34) synthetase TilS n=1 Tax=Thalassotalea maritima TaxID=3242416 RepID=UPI00352742B6
MSSVDNLRQQVISFLQQYDLMSADITLAYSGGCDSQVLLHVLATLKSDKLLDGHVKAIHVHHGLSSNADDWLSFTERQAKQMNVSYQAVRVNVIRQSRSSIEAQARQARYQALAEHSSESSVILTAHHVDDQLETMMLALKRGSGISGLAAMLPIRDLTISGDDNVDGLQRDNQPLSSTSGAQQRQPTTAGSQRLARPLLTVSRHEIEQYAKHYQLSWVEDESNCDQRFDRNFLRQSVLPTLSQRWPHIASSAARAASHLQEAQRLLQELAEIDYQRCTNDAGHLRVERLQQLSSDRQNNVLRYVFMRRGLSMPSTAQLQQIKLQLIAGRSDSQPQIKLTDHIIRRHKKLLMFTNELADISDWQIQLAIGDLPQTITLPDGLGQLEVSLVTLADQDVTVLSRSTQCILPIAQQTESITLDFAYQNSKVWPHFRHKRRDLKKVYQEQQIPSWQRDRLLNVRINNMLAAVVGVFVNKDYLHSIDNESQASYRCVQIRLLD